MRNAQPVTPAAADRSPVTDHADRCADRCVDDLRSALSTHGITLPSLHVDVPTFAGTHGRTAGLVALGNCNTETARKLIAALRGAGLRDGSVLLEVVLAAVPEVVPELRRTLRACLGAPCPDVQLCVTELVGNVIRHVGEGVPVRVRVSRSGDRARVEVTDPGARALPVLRHAAADDETGRGMALLDSVSLRWGAERGESGKTVWCELAWGEPGRAA
ncbi:ATP-binding protein [Streptomyces sp. NPDC019990]|uniref:ATP-binding protein n=1 Tax=Streptomyces sp. NPDC019990 TaxID=3154693 RepID=UPI0033D963BD